MTTIDDDTRFGRNANLELQIIPLFFFLSFHISSPIVCSGICVDGTSGLCVFQIFYLNGLLFCTAGMHSCIWASAISILFIHTVMLYHTNVCSLCKLYLLARVFVFSLFMTSNCGRVFNFWQLASKYNNIAIDKNWIERE